MQDRVRESVLVCFYAFCYRGKPDTWVILKRVLIGVSGRGVRKRVILSFFKVSVGGYIVVSYNDKGNNNSIELYLSFKNTPVSVDLNLPLWVGPCSQPFKSLAKLTRVGSI